MYISKINNTQNFGRAFTTDEKKAYSRLLKDSKKALNIEDTTAVVFDFNVPSDKGFNVGIGSTFSESMEKFTEFLRSITGITSIQLQPQGKISKNNKSPYSGTNFAIGEHIIDLKKLTSYKYAALLSLEDIKTVDKKYPMDKSEREYITNYNYTIGDNKTKGVQNLLLEKAYNNYIKKLNSKDKQALELEKEFLKFQKENEFWLEKDCIFEALTAEYSSDSFYHWNETDKNLYSKKCLETVRQQRINELNQKYTDVIEFEKFKQFIADKQQKESRDFFNSKNIKLYGDCLLGFQKSEIWSNPDCFIDNLYYGGPDPDCPETNNIQTWGLNALDYTQLGNCSDNGDISNLGEVGKLLYNKFTNFFKRYDGIRTDAAWQFITPFIYKEENGSYQEVKSPDIDSTILNILNAAAENVLGGQFDKNNPDNIMLELVGLSADKSKTVTFNIYPHLYTTAYAEYNETPKIFSDKGYKNSKFYVGVGNHDNDSLVNMAKDKEKRKLHLAGIKQDYNYDLSNIKYNTLSYKNQTEEEQQQEDYRNAKFSEIFTASKQFFTLPDMFGMSERINVSGKSNPNNWKVRIPSDYERFYYNQLSKGYGLNIPKALENAMRMKKCNNNKLMEKCAEAAEILRSSGPMTTKEADEKDLEGKLKNKFEYFM